MPSGVLFVHNNFPAQFRDLVNTLRARGVPCAAIAGANAPGLPSTPEVPDILMGRYGLQRGTTPGIFNLAVRAEADLIRARGALNIARAFKERGFDPQVIVGHPGWGETALLEDAYPDAKVILYPEFFYHGRGLDIDFDPEFPLGDDALLQGKAKNGMLALSLTDADAIVCPTAFQASVLPSVFQPRVRIIHEGVDVEAIQPGPAEPFFINNDLTIQPGAPVITHVNNQLEPLRGLHVFLRSLPRLMAEVPDAQVIVFGLANGRPYGGSSPDGRAWREVFLDGLEIDERRLHFLGRTPHALMLKALRLSTAHVYYTYPFVLSWSLVEAMASGCYVIGSDTPPLHDAIEDGVNGRLLPFFDVEALSDALIEACRNPQAAAPLRAAARQTAVAQFSRKDGRAAWLKLLEEMGVEIPTEPRP
jgi:glycosyltransferase involved in cell wall biosynthesis